MIRVLNQGLIVSSVFLGVALCPQKMTTLDHRIFWSQPLRIVLPKTSPAHAALEDLKEDLFKAEPPQSQNLKNNKETVRQLAAGEFRAHDLLKYRTVINNKAKPEVARTIRLATLVVREFKAKPVYIAQSTTAVAPLASERKASEAFFEQKSETHERVNNIYGRVELQEGLALWDPNMQLRVKQIIDGQPVSETMASKDDGQFVLPTQVGGGTLIAELVNAQNQVYGAGQIVVPSGKRAAVLPVLPSQQGLQTRMVSAASHGGESFAVQNGLLSVLGAPGAPMKAEHKVSFNEPMIENGSRVLLQASGDKHNTTLAMGLTGAPMDVSVLPKSMSKAMLNLSLDEQDRYGADDLGMVWGKVVQNGSPVKGARVQITDGIEPVYFNELYLPDKNLQGTSENGLFAFVKLNSGLKSIRVFQDDQVVAAEVMPVDVGHVSQINFELLGDKKVRFTPFAYGAPGKPQMLYANIIGLETEKDIANDESYWNLKRSNRPLMVEFSAGPDFERTRQLILPSQDKVDVPTFKRAWVDQILKDNGIQRAAYSSMVIGFGPSSAFHVETAGGQVVYLTRDHKVTKHGEPNGAFIISNMKSDIQVVNVVDEQTGLRWIQTVVTEPDVTNVLIHPRAE